MNSKDKSIHYKQQLDTDPTNYLDLWKYFTDDAGKIKDKMWTITAFFATVLGGLIAYVVKIISDNKTEVLIESEKYKVLVITVSIVGCSLSGFSIFMIKKYGDHIRSCWNRANYIRFRIEGLSEIWCFDNPVLIKEDEVLRTTSDNRIPKVAKRLMIFMGFYFLIFFVLGVVVLIKN